MTWQHREKIVITVIGPLDLVTTPRFTEILHAHLRATTPMLVLDLTGVTFLGGVAIEALLHAEHHARTTGQHLTLVTDTHAVDRALQALELTCRFAYGDQPLATPAKAAPSAQPPPARRAPETVPAEVPSHAATTG